MVLGCFSFFAFLHADVDDSKKIEDFYNKIKTFTGKPLKDATEMKPADFQNYFVNYKLNKELLKKYSVFVSNQIATADQDSESMALTEDIEEKTKLLEGIKAMDDDGLGGFKIQRTKPGDKHGKVLLYKFSVFDYLDSIFKNDEGSNKEEE